MADATPPPAAVPPVQDGDAALDVAALYADALKVTDAGRNSPAAVLLAALRAVLDAIHSSPVCRDHAVRRAVSEAREVLGP